MELDHASVDRAWWADAVVYQLYLKSYADGNADGVGDINGARARLAYVRDLGVDAIWLSPWYKSPMVDAGYDVADFRQVDAQFGTLEDSVGLLDDAHALGLRVIVDIVPNHVSSQHEWFRAALAHEAGARERFVFREGRGADGSLPPNDWRSTFGGSAWSRVEDGAWYLHMFAPEQPDLNWENDEVRQDFEAILRYWFDLGVDGMRIDVANGLVKDQDFPDARGAEFGDTGHPAFDQDGVHEVYRAWRRIAAEYVPERFFVGEVWTDSNARLARYVRPDELQAVFQFDFLQAPWDAKRMREVIETALEQADEIGSMATWVLGNHDVTRVVTRYARSQPDVIMGPAWDRTRWDEPADLERGVRRARAAALLQLALPGTAYVYQGDELGLEECETIPASRRQDPIWRLSGGTDVGRDGCRVPLPYAGTEPPYGFTAAPAARTWLPQPRGWAAKTVAAQNGDPHSTLELYRLAIRLRRKIFEYGASFEWMETVPGALLFRHGRGWCLTNFGTAPIDLPLDALPILASGERSGPAVAGPDETVWFTREQVGS